MLPVDHPNADQLERRTLVPKTVSQCHYYYFLIILLLWINCVLAFLRQISSNYIKMSGFPPRNVPYHRYQNTYFCNFARFLKHPMKNDKIRGISLNFGTLCIFSNKKKNIRRGTPTFVPRRVLLTKMTTLGLPTAPLFIAEFFFYFNPIRYGVSDQRLGLKDPP